MNRTQPGYIVDSILPMEEQLRRFRLGIRDIPIAFDGAPTSRDELMGAFVRAVESADTSALVRLTVSRAEFAWLVFPESPLMAPPYELAPDLAWLQFVAASSKGLERLLKNLGGSSLGYQSMSCDESPAIEGQNRIWKNCRVTFMRPGEKMKTLQLFASLIERDRRFKILSYDNAY